MMNTVLAGEYFTAEEVFDLSFAHHMYGWDYPVSGDDMARRIVK